jgi:hypothetical protein
MASYLFSQLKLSGFKIELVNEYVKSWAYLNRVPKNFDQVYIFGKQTHYESRFLDNGVPFIVTDSPVFLSYCYAKKYSPTLARPILNLCNIYDEFNPCVNVLLERKDKKYDTYGRFQTEEEAREMDDFIRTNLIETGRSWIEGSLSEKEVLFNVLRDILENE